MTFIIKYNEIRSIQNAYYSSIRNYNDFDGAGITLYIVSATKVLLFRCHAID